MPEIEDLSNINKISTTYQQLQHINKIQQKNQQISKISKISKMMWYYDMILILLKDEAWQNMLRHLCALWTCRFTPPEYMNIPLSQLIYDEKNNEFLMNFMSFDSVVECSEWFMMSLCHRRAGEPMRRRQEHSFQDMGMDQYLLIPFSVGWTSIYQLFWCSPGVHMVDMWRRCLWISVHTVSSFTEHQLDSVGFNWCWNEIV